MFRLISYKSVPFVSLCIQIVFYWYGIPLGYGIKCGFITRVQHPFDLRRTYGAIVLINYSISLRTVVANIKWNALAAICGVRSVLLAPHRGRRWRHAALVARLLRSRKHSWESPPWRVGVSTDRSSVSFHVTDHCTLVGSIRTLPLSLSA